MYYLKATNNIFNGKFSSRRILRLCSAVYSTQTTKQQQSSSLLKNTAKTIPNVVLIDAVRTPFAISNTVYSKLMAVNLQRHALKGILCLKAFKNLKKNLSNGVLF